MISIADRLSILRMASDLGPVWPCPVYFLSAALAASQKSKLLSKRNPSVSTAFHFETARFLASAPQTPKNKSGLDIKAMLDFSAYKSAASSAAKRGLSERRTCMRGLCSPREQGRPQDIIVMRQLSHL